MNAESWPQNAATPPTINAIWPLYAAIHPQVVTRKGLGRFRWRSNAASFPLFAASLRAQIPGALQEASFCGFTLLGKGGNAAKKIHRGLRSRSSSVLTAFSVRPDTEVAAKSRLTDRLGEGNAVSQGGSSAQSAGQEASHRLRDTSIHSASSAGAHSAPPG